MRILLPTGSATAEIVRAAAGRFCDRHEIDVAVTGELASFLTPGELRRLLAAGAYDMAIVSGMCTASFADVERETGVPVYRGPRHAADLPQVLAVLGRVTLSRTVPADDFLAETRREEASRRLALREAEAGAYFTLRGVKIGGGSRMKVLAEIMDAHRREDLLAEVRRFFADGADIVDLGFGFDATADDVRRCFAALSGVEGPLAVDTQDPILIAAAMPRADLVLSLHEGNIPAVGKTVADAGAAAVVVPGERTLAGNLAAAKEAGISRLIADPLLQPVGSGLVPSLAGFSGLPCPAFFGAGNVAELLDADSPGVNALLAGMAHEVGAAVVFTSEHSDKTRGSVAEMRRATEMMALMAGRPYPKDLGLDLLLLKEKRRRREPPLAYESIMDAHPAPDEIVYDPLGCIRIGIEGDFIVAVHKGRAVRGRCWEDVFHTLLLQGSLSRLDHAAYLGKELFKAELAIRLGRGFEQDGPF
ncbi:dihydropteroate synthase-like protein [Methanoculleus sp. Wushi-C6]|uniref:Dihydropteroate synthase-like protein n=1 Tax=Methanoculleus caldifontis TaxID=2651577 RepID=A0ABU3WZ84_9EURY|nr:dihydropteroate synthase-like protein [Methanoculleus sp. Wushi-C6]MDV2480875.1 dihydropteroate synthase-like protein [Methanoculleus sp. Wushi-C6]